MRLTSQYVLPVTLLEPMPSELTNKYSQAAYWNGCTTNRESRLGCG